MNEYELTKKIIEWLQGYWDLAEWMLALLEAWFMDEETSQNIRFLLLKEIKKIPDEEKKWELQEQYQELENLTNLKEDKQEIKEWN
jgi:hypothetical protein